MSNLEAVIQKDLAPPVNEHLDQLEKSIIARLQDIGMNIWQLGEELSIARNYFNSDEHFGKWVSDIMSDTDKKTLYRYRLLFDVFGSNQEEIEFIPKTYLYQLSTPKFKDDRWAIIDDIRERAQSDSDFTKAKEVKGHIVQEVIETYHPKKESEQAKPKPQPTAGGLDLTNEEIILGKILFNTCFPSEVKKYPQRYNMDDFESLKDKFTALYNSL